MSEDVLWTPRAGNTGDDRYKHDDSNPRAGSTAFAVTDLPTLTEVNATAGMNQAIAEVRRRYFNNITTKLTVATVPYVSVDARLAPADITTARVYINDPIRRYENRGYFTFTTTPASGARIDGTDILEFRKSLAMDTLNARWFLCRGTNSLLNNTKYGLCSDGAQADVPVAWRGTPLVNTAATPRPILGVFNGMPFGPTARFNDLSCRGYTIYANDGAGNPLARLGSCAVQWGNRVVARGSTKVGSTFGGSVIYSDDWGVTWTRATIPNFSQNGYNWTFRAIMSANILQTSTGRLIVAGTTNRADDATYERGDAIWYSDDGGTTWTGRLVYAHRDSQFVYAGTPCNLFEYGGKVYMFTVFNSWTANYYRHESADNGLNWGNRVSFSPIGIGNFARVWAFSSGALIMYKNTDTTSAPSQVIGVTWRSVDLGLTWTNIQSALNLHSVWKAGDVLYAMIPDATSGFFNFCKSIDAGGSFSIVCQTDLPIDSYRGFPSGSETTYCNDLVLGAS